ncbi:FG-GAP repeat domain-containing protein [Candidatus Riflebacteria bacterium]
MDFEKLPKRPWLPITETSPLLSDLQKKIAAFNLLKKNPKKAFLPSPNFMASFSGLMAIEKDDASPFYFFKNGKDESLKNYSQYFDLIKAHLKNIEVKSFKNKINEIYVSKDRTEIVFCAFWWLKGVNEKTGTRLHEKGRFRVFIRKEEKGDGKYRVENLKLQYLHRATYDGEPFIERYLSPFWQIDAKTQKEVTNSLNNRRPLSTGGLNVIDLNNDGFLDVFFAPNFTRAFLYINDTNGGFIDRTEQWGLDFGKNLGNGATSLFVDLDNDGDLDFINSQVLGITGEEPSILAMENIGKKYILKAKALSFKSEGNLPIHKELKIFIHTTVVPADINGDGLIDIYVAGYSNPGHHIVDNLSNLNSRNGVQNLLFINHGNWQFTEESRARGLFSDQMTQSAIFWDYDNDGDVDLLEGNDFAPDDFFLNKGNGFFEKSSVLEKVLSIRATMGYFYADVDNDLKLDIYSSGMYSKAGNRFLNLVKDRYSKELWENVKIYASGNGLLSRSKSGQYRDLARELKVNIAGWCWGSSIFDIENDGDQEIFVVNGFTTHEDSKKPDY